MNGRTILLAMVALVVSTTATASALSVVEKEDFKLDLGGYVQALGVAEHVPDKVRDENRLYLFLKEARVQMSGSVYKIPFEVMLATGGEDITPNTNAALGLLDFNFDVPVGKQTAVKVGQFLVPYGRERLTSDNTMSFGERSVENLGFAWNRDYGFALSTRQGNVVGSFAVMTGGGRDIPQRYLPEKLGVPMLVARVGYDDGIDRDVYHVTGRDLAPERAQKAVYVNALYLQDSSIGHSTVVNVRASDKNLLINANYNPFIAKAPFSLGTIWQAGGDAAYRAPLRTGVVNAEAQVDFSHYDNKYGSLSLHGGRVQVGYSVGDFAATVRYAALWLDDKMAYVNNGVAYPITTSSAPIQEITPSLTWQYRPGMALVADLPIYRNMLVFQENTIGSYVMSEQPDQVTVIKPGTTPGTGRSVRDNVIEARLMVQLGF